MATDLFEAERQESAERPLADRMRPKSLDEFAGQAHLLDEGKPLRRALEQGRIHRNTRERLLPAVRRCVCARRLAAGDTPEFDVRSCALTIGR